ncbi:MAG: hypothetical protein FWG13_02000, partial [Leptospirales bacterium]|nr:hypothetical protein [Leptospirales bacterium]
MKRFAAYLFLIAALFAVSCYKGKLTDKEKQQLKDVEAFNRDYGSKGVTIKNLKIGWEENFVCNGLILKNSVIKNVELQDVKLKNMYIENSTIENVSVTWGSDLSGSTFKNVRFKNFKSINHYATPSDLDDSIFIDCEFINCEYSDVTLGKEYRNCRFNKIKEIGSVSYYKTVVIDCTYTNCKLKSAYHNAKFENVIFKDSVVKIACDLEYGKNIQFANCSTSLAIRGKAEDILVQDSILDGGVNMGFSYGDMKNIVIRDCLEISHLGFFEGAFDNISIINCKNPIVRFSHGNFSNILIKDSTVAHLKFDETDVSGDNRIENCVIWGNFYGQSKVRDLTITDCVFEDYADIVFSELIRFKLSNNTYEGEVRHAVKGERFIDSDRFPLKSTPFPENSDYLKGYIKEKKKKQNKKRKKKNPNFDGGKNIK